MGEIAADAAFDIKDGKEDTACMALIVMYEGEGVCLVHDTPEWTSDWQDEIETWTIEHDLPADGVFLCRVHLVDDGEGDYPGVREYRPELAEWRRATAAEWNDHRCGNYPWSPGD